MGLFASSELHRIDLGDGDWIDIRKDVSVEQAWEIRQHSDDVGEGTLSLLVALVVAWSATEPVTPESVAQLRFSIADRIIEEYNKLNRFVVDQKHRRRPRPVS